MTPHFQDEELACKCDCGMLPESTFMDKVERLRVACGFPFPVSSAARCLKHDKNEGGVGVHPTGRALDLTLFGALAFKVLQLAPGYGFTGIGLRQHGPFTKRLVHLDDLPDAPGRPRPTVWTYP